MNSKNDAKQTAKAALINTIINFMVMAVGAVTVPIITRIMPVRDVGVANTFFSTRNVLAILVSLANYSYVSKAMLDFKEEKKEILFTLMVMCFTLTLLFFGGLYPFRNPLKKLLSLDDFLFLWLFISSLMMALFYIAFFYCAFHNYIIKSATIVSLNGIVAPGVSIVLILTHNMHKAHWRILGLDISLLAVSMVLITWLLTCSKRQIKKRYLTQMLSFSLPLVPHQLSQMVLTQCDLIMISSLADAVKSGIYSMGHLIGYLSQTALTQVFSAWSPWVLRRLEAEEQKTIYDYSRYIVLIAAVFDLGLVTISPELIHIFLPPDYKDCIYIVPVLVAAMFLASMNTLFFDVMYFYKKTRQIAGISTTAAVLNIILNFLLIPRFGYMVAAYTTFFSYFLMLLCSCGYAIRLDVQHIYDLRFVVIVCVAVPMYAGVDMFLVKDLVARYVVLGVLILILFIKYRRDVLRILREIR